MSNFLSDLFMGLLVNCISVPLFAFLTYAVFLVLAKQQKNALFKFFGLSEQSPEITIYVSRLQIMPSGTVAVGDATINKGYSGPAINFVEYEGAYVLRNLLRSRLYTLLPRGFDTFMRFLLGNHHVRLLRLDPEIKPSPLFSDKPAFIEKLSKEPSASNPLIRAIRERPDQDIIDVLNMSSENEEQINSEANLILIGNGLYNLYSQFFLTEEPFKSSIPFEFKPNAVNDRGLFIDDIEIPGRPPRELAVIQRLVGPKGNSVFICAGVGSRATKASALWLAENWHNMPSSKEFTIYLSCGYNRADESRVHLDEISNITADVIGYVNVERQRVKAHMPLRS